MSKKDNETNEASESAETKAAEASQPAAELTAEEIEALKAKAAKADEHWDRLLRLNADFDNFKKRATREKQEAIKFANEDILEKLVPVIDNFDMAMMAAESASAGSAESLKVGVKMIYGQLKSALSEAGLEEVDAAGKAFDPNWHEAVSHQESKDVKEGDVLQQLRKGYKLKDRLIRPATVIVAKKPA